MRFLDYYEGFKLAFLQHEFLNYGRKESKFIAHNEPRDIVDFKKLDSGCLVYVKGEKYPIRGNMITDKVEDLAKSKRIVHLFFKFLEQEGFKKWIVLLGATRYWELFIDIIHWQLGDVYAETNFYSQPVREVYRVFTEIYGKYDWNAIPVAIKIRDILCAILEYDTAYKYRFQDIVGELNKEEFEKNPIKEIERLAKLMFEREQSGNYIILYFKKYLSFALLYLKFNKKLLKQIQEIVKRININEIKLSPEDIYWSNINKSYNFRGISAEERLKDYEKQKNN